MGFGFWLRFLLTLAAFWGSGSKETVFGILGEPTVLRLPRALGQRGRAFAEAAWKESLEGQQKKRFLLRFSRENLTEFQPGRLRFHRDDFSLEILNTSREDGRIYEFSLSRGQEEEVWQLQLRVLERVSHPDIRILHREFSNGSCSLALLCSSERGDEVSYSWDSPNGTAGVCFGLGPLLNVSLSPAMVTGTSPGCVCTARNAVSSRRRALQAGPELCRGGPDTGVPRVRTELLVLLVAFGLIIVIVIIVIVTFRVTKGDPVTSQDTPDTVGATIYAQVQKPKAIVPKATPVSCTTIYAAATGPPLAPEGPSVSPSVSPKPRGHSPLSQEPTTVYASVTLPVA
ncbi:signaling lymphocytic activation molecule [Sylvia atricapilla]|uniref:signaling lymphocytic activation molecule n=1 Tax=Sylvia atricapilla TaxID=48155 RepID=UPI00339AD983